MWFLECDSDLLKGKKLWLRPGTTHLLGRTKKAEPDSTERVQWIDHKSVSRKHLIVAVDSVKAGDSAHLHSKTKLTVTDGSKLGTLIDGQKLVKDSKVLDKKEHKVKLGSYEIEFRFKWQPRVLSFTSLTRASKQAADPLADQRVLLEPLDIKCITEYITEYTTHVVNKKRNTAAVLQALVNGRHVVTGPYVEAIARAGKQSVDTENFNRSLLEQDFEANWPGELEYLPGPGNEPNPRPDNDPIFLPKDERSEMFGRYTFIFCDPTQYETLMPIVTGGGGKALLRQVQWSDEAALEMVSYVKEVAGKKGAGTFKLSQQAAKGGVVIVRAGDKSHAGVPEFYQTLDLVLDQRSMEQNEFLDAILDVDAASLKRALEVEIVEENHNTRSAPVRQEPPESPTAARALRRQSTQRSSPPQPQAAKDDPPRSSQPAEAANTRKRRRIITQSRFTGFDDFDPSQLPKNRSPSPSQSIAREPGQAPSVQDMEVDSQSQAPVSQIHLASQAAGERKRPAEFTENNANYLDDMLVGAAAMKKRKLEEQKSGKHALTKDEDDMADDSAASKSKKAKRSEPEVDYRQNMRDAREKDDRRRQEDEETLRNALQGMDVNEMRNLAQVEEMEITHRSPTPRSRDTANGDRWDPAWNGRTNFKKFKKARQGQADGTDSRGPQRRRVIVETEQYKTKTYGMGEDYWLEPESNSTTKDKSQKSKRESQSQTQPRNGTATQNSSTRVLSSVDTDATPAGRLGQRIRNSRIQDVEAEAAADDSIMDDTPLLPSQRPKSTAAQKKRPAAEPLESAAAKKRQTRIAPTPKIELDDNDDDDDDDTLKFRRRRRG